MPSSEIILTAGIKVIAAEPAEMWMTPRHIVQGEEAAGALEKKFTIADGLRANVGAPTFRNHFRGGRDRRHSDGEVEEAIVEACARSGRR